MTMEKKEMTDQEREEIETMQVALGLIFGADYDAPAFKWREADKRIEEACARLVKLREEARKASYCRDLTHDDWAEKLGALVAPYLIKLANTKTRMKLFGHLLIAGYEAAERMRHEDHTAWQWLRYHHRVPIDRNAGHWDGPYEKQWFYYDRQNTRPVDYCEYDDLKHLYIAKFGGWDEIDLENTTYDGHAWWPEDPEEFQRAVEEARPR